MLTTAASQSSSNVSRSLITASVFASSRISVQMVGIPISVGTIASIPYVRANSDSPIGFRWLFCRPITLLVVLLPIFLWLNVNIFSELIGVFYYMFPPGCCFMGTAGSSIGFLFLIRCKSSYIPDYRIMAHYLSQSIGVFRTYTQCSSI